MKSKEALIRKDEIVNFVANLIVDMLELDTVEQDTPFIELGMKSLDIPFFIKKVTRKFEVNPPITSVFENSTIHSYADYLFTLLGGASEIQPKQEKKKENTGRHDTVAVIGMSCRFPGGANTPEEYWDLLISHQSGISNVPTDRWDSDTYYSENKLEAGKMYTTKGGFLNVPIDEFDAPFFNISPKEALSLDPQQRLLLELTWEAFESAGLNIHDYNGSNTGVYVGMAGEEYSLSHYKSGDLDIINAYSLTGTTFSTACGRISYTFGFEGPCMSIDTACSSSLTALHIACKALQNHEVDLAVVSGVNLMVSPAIHVCFSKIEAISVDGHCKSFDESANGYSRSEGGGVLILKRTEDAKADNDTSLGIISGTAVNQDGKSNGLTAPNGAAQEKVIKKALQDADLKVEDIDYIEMHGTGTKLGDPIEVNAVINSYGVGRTEEQPLRIGSVKSNIGHLEAAAGIASIIKVLLSFKYNMLPANLNYHTPNPYIDWERSSLEVVDRNTVWEAAVKRAGINGFGFGGSNAHIIVSEPDLQQADKTLGQINTEMEYILKITGKSQAAVKANSVKMLDFINKNTQINLENITYTNNTYKSDFNKRISVTGKSRDELVQCLESYITDQEHGRVIQAVKDAAIPKLVFLYTGQGSQYIGMGKQLFDQFNVFRQAFEHCSRLFDPYLNHTLTVLLYSHQYDDEFISNTRYAQPLIFSIEYALDQLWDSLNIKPDIVIGHSIGEYSAAVRSGIMTLEDAVMLLAKRSALMAQLPRGSMASIFTDIRTVKELIKDCESQVSIAVINSKTNIVISGQKEAVETVVLMAKQSSIKSSLLNVSHAFHSAMMQPIVHEFEQFASAVTFKPSNLQFISTKLGRYVAEGEILDSGYWAEHIVDTVDFNKAIEGLKELKDVFCLEIGAAKVLSVLGEIILGEQQVILSSMDRKTDNIAQLYKCIGNLYCNGFSVNWNQLYNSSPEKVQLPTYAFDRKSYWLKLNHQMTEKGDYKKELRNIVGQKIVTPLLKNTLVYQNEYSEEYPYFMKEHIIFDNAIAPAASHLSMLFSKAKDFRGNTPLSLENIEFHKPIIAGKHKQTVVQYVFSNVSSDNIPFKLLSSAPENVMKDNWSEHCKGTLTETKAANSNKVVSIEELERMYPVNKSDFTVYDVMRKFGFNLGSGFTRISKVWNNSLCGVCRIDPWGEVPADEEYEIYPGTVDSILQSLLAVSELCVKMNADVEHYALKTAIPISIGKVTYYYQEAKTLWCHVKVENSQKDGVLGNIEVYNEKGEIVLEIEKLLAVLTDRAALLKSLDKAGNNMLYNVEWVKAGKSGSINPASFNNVHFILLAGNSILATALYKRLYEYGNKGTVVSVEELNKLNSKEAMQAYMKKILDDSSQTYKVVYIPASADDEISNSTSHSIAQRVQKSSMDMLYLIQSLSESNAANRVKVSIVTENALGLLKKRNDFTQSVLWGFAKVIALEYPKIWGSIVDYAAGQDEADLDALILELTDISEEQVGLLEGRQRLVSRLVRTNSGTEKQTMVIHPDASYLITGGLGGIGLTYAEYLIKRGARFLILVSRREPSVDTLRRMDQWRDKNVTIKVIHLDISKEFSVNELTGGQMPEIRGVVHAAGALRDRMIADQNQDSFEEVLSVKVLGAIHLHKALSGQKLDFFFMMSSISSIIGNVGQSNYASANYFMNSFAQYRRNCGLPALSICWGPWAEVGMAAADKENLKRVAARGIYALPIERCEQLIEQSFEVDEPCVMAADMNWNMLNEATDHAGIMNLLDRLATNSEERRKNNSKTKQVVSIVSELISLNEAQRDHLLQHTLKLAVSKIMGFQDENTIQADIPITEQGADSLMLFAMKTEISKLIGLEIDISVFYNYPTLRALSEYLLSRIFTDNGNGHADTNKDSSIEDLLLEISSLIE